MFGEKLVSHLEYFVWISKVFNVQAQVGQNANPDKQHLWDTWWNVDQNMGYLPSSKENDWNSYFARRKYFISFCKFTVVFLIFKFHLKISSG